ncbi:MAG: zf-TFIIB domain-containing protein [Fibrobacteria bacterium]
MDKPKTMQCPKCRATMEEVNYHDILVQRCVACKGIWFEGVSHKDLKNHRGAERIDIGPEELGRAFDHLADVHCPDCGKPMQRVPDPFKPHLHYDACPAHDGFFFDAGEFRDFKKDTLADFFKDLALKFKKPG